MKKITSLFTLFTAFFLGGCQYGGLVSVMGTPGHHEKEITAEYDLAEHKDQKTLVLVNQPGWINTDVNLRYYLTKAISKNLMEKVKIPPENLVSYGELSEFRSNKSDFSLLSPVEVGEALDANIVMLAVIEDYQLHEVAEAGCYEGFLAAQVVLLDTATAEQLWPEPPKSKGIKVGFEIDNRGRIVAAQRLVAACAYCTTRYLYNCRKSRFSIAEDRSGIGWKDWNK